MINKLQQQGHSKCCDGVGGLEKNGCEVSYQHEPIGPFT